MTVGPTTTTGDPSTQSAVAIITDALTQAGLGSLATTVWGWWKEGQPLAQISNQVYQTPEFNTRFPAYKTLASLGRAISPAQYINLEQTYTSVLRAAGLPSSFYDQPDDFAKLIGSEVSPAEFQQRVQSYQTLAYQMPKEVLDDFARQSGFTDWNATGWTNGDLAAFFIDPDKALPAIQNRLTQAEIGGASTLTGYGQLSLTEEQRLQSLGVDYTKATTGFENLQRLAPLFNTLPGEAGTGITREQQLGAAFGNDATDKAAIEAEAARRLAEFQAGGSVAGGRQGLTGAGVAV